MTVDQRIDALHTAAMAQTGLSDFGLDDYREGLLRFLQAVAMIEDDKELHAAAAEQTALGLLCSRLITQHSWNDNPGWRDRSVIRPVIVMGIPRSGTTALHHLLSLDPQFQGLEHWFVWGPMARPPRRDWADNPQYQAAVERLAAWRAAAPETMDAHSGEPDDYDECLTPMAQTFLSNFLTSMHDIPDYDAWFRSQDETRSYARYRDILKLVGMRDDRPWLLKNPSHTFGVEAMLNVFPDAYLIQTHRHPAQSVASLVSLLSGFRELMGGKKIDRALVEARESSFWSDAMRHTMALEDRQPGRIANVWQHEIRDDPMGIVQRIYGQFWLTLSAQAEQAMRQWAADNPPHAKSSHAYKPVESERPLLEAFAPYIERYRL